MNLKAMKIIGAVLVLAGVFSILAGPAWLGAQESESSYWNKFKSIFVDWDDDAQPGSSQTAVCGVRGVNVEESLGTKGYSWDDVTYMEQFPVSMNAEKQFLKEGKLGPYQGR